MTTATAGSPLARFVTDASRQLLSLAIGLGVSWAIFFGLSRLQRPAIEEPAPPIEDLRAVALPVEPPPPPNRPQEMPQISTNNLITLETERTDSVVKLPAVPIVTDTVPPALGIPRIDFAMETLKPAPINPEFDSKHVYTVNEVDRRCLPLVRTRPLVNNLMLRAAKHMQATFNFIVNRDGSVEGIRLISSSGSRDLDEACAAALKDWRFRPAMRRNRSVRQWVEQRLTFKLDRGSPLEVIN